MARTLAIITALLLTGCSVIAETRYEITDLGIPTNTSFIHPHDINNDSQIVGYGYYNLDFYGFLWHEHVLNIIENSMPWQPIPQAINDQGEVTGHARIGSGFPPQRAFLWRDGSAVDIGTLGGNESWGYDINNIGHITGQSTLRPIDDYNKGHAFLWKDNRMIDLGHLGGNSSRAYALNDCGMVTGESHTVNRLLHAFLWYEGQMVDLDNSTHAISAGLDINNIGQIVGFARDTPGSYSQPYMWYNGSMIRLNTPTGNGGGATDINELGQIVGSYGVYGKVNWNRACIWQDGIMTDLNDVIDVNTHWVLTSASAVNDRGEIVGYGRHEGVGRAFFMTPILYVSIDIKPGNADNNVNPKSQGTLPVAILTTPEFNTTSVDVNTIRLAGAPPTKWNPEDVDADGDTDLMLHFRMQDLQLTTDCTQLTLTGRTLQDKPIEGSDSITIIGK